MKRRFKQRDNRRKDERAAMPSATWKLRATGGPTAVDVEEVRRSLSVLVDPDYWVELRGLPSGKSYIRKGSDLDGLCQAAIELSDNRNIYYGINPVRSEQVHGTSGGATKEDIANRRWVLIDVDPVKPDPDLSATDDEKESARMLAEKVMNELSSQEWPAPLLIDSGNGWHLMYRVDLPNDNHSQSLVKSVLYNLAKRFDNDAAKIDKSVHNPSRIAKLPGTWARKGPDEKNRPYRQAKMIHCPIETEILSIEKLQSVANNETTPSSSASQFTIRAGGDRTAYAQAALEREIARVVLAVPGPQEGRNNALNRAGYSMGQLVAAGLIFRQEVESKLRFAALKAGLSEEEIERTLPRAISDGEKQPRQIPENNGKHDGPKFAKGEVIIIRASSIKPRHVEWIWPGRIPLGKLTTFAGQGGLGKTFVLCDITARITRGAEWPDSVGECTEPGQVLFVSGEDDLDDTIVPRLIEMNADLSKVIFLKTSVQDEFKLSDLETLNTAVKQAGRDVRFVAIDPPTAYLGKVDDHKNAELRGLLSPLKNWAAERRIALVFNTHVNKPQGAKVEAMMRVMGSVAWVNAVRAAHMFAKDPDDPERRLFCGMKLNIGKEKKGLAYRILSTDKLARVEWLGEVDTTADEAINRDRSRPRQLLATEWLVEIFSQKLEWSSDEFWASAKHHNISKNAIDEARVRLFMPKPRKSTSTHGDSTWVWWVPPDWPPLVESRQVATANDDEAGF